MKHQESVCVCKSKGNNGRSYCQDDQQSMMELSFSALSLLGSPPCSSSSNLDLEDSEGNQNNLSSLTMSMSMGNLSSIGNLSSTGNLASYTNVVDNANRLAKRKKGMERDMSKLQGKKTEAAVLRTGKNSSEGSMSGGGDLLQQSQTDCGGSCDNILDLRLLEYHHDDAKMLPGRGVEGRSRRESHRSSTVGTSERRRVDQKPRLVVHRQCDSTPEEEVGLALPVLARATSCGSSRWDTNASAYSGGRRSSDSCSGTGPIKRPTRRGSIDFAGENP